MTDYLTHPINQQFVESYTKQPSNSLLATGHLDSDIGSFLNYLSRQINPEQNQVGSIYRLKDYLDEEDKSYSLDDLRKVLNELNLTQFATFSVRLIIIEDCHLLSEPAQNVLLKHLEEPPPKTYFLLGSHQPNRIIPTVKSRCYRLSLKRPLRQDVYRYFKDYPAEELDEAYLIADGWFEPMRNILSNREKSQIMIEVKAAKEFLKLQPSDKITYLNPDKQASTETNKLEQVIYGLRRTSLAAMRSSSLKNDWQKAYSWYLELQRVEKMITDYENDVSPKLIICRLSLP